jgi:hypothetical protein
MCKTENLQQLDRSRLTCVGCGTKKYTEEICMGTGFYDKSIKNLMQKCQRLVVIAINSIFNRCYDENAEVTFLDKEMVGDKESESTYMDMLVEIMDGSDTGKFHWEFQLQEGSLISIRVYEYATRETLRAARENLENVEEYELYVEMPDEVTQPIQCSLSLAGCE